MAETGASYRDLLNDVEAFVCGTSEAEAVAGRFQQALQTLKPLFLNLLHHEVRPLVSGGGALGYG